MGIPE